MCVWGGAFMVWAIPCVCPPFPILSISNRLQYVVVNGESSPPVRVISGVPQGSVLGPLLLIIHTWINGVTNAPLNHGQLLLSADDILLYEQIQDYRDYLLLQQDLDSIQYWFIQVCMKVNPSKCKYAWFFLGDAPQCYRQLNWLPWIYPWIGCLSLSIWVFGWPITFFPGLKDIQSITKEAMKVYRKFYQHSSTEKKLHTGNMGLTKISAYRQCNY